MLRSRVHHRSRRLVGRAAAALLVAFVVGCHSEAGTAPRDDYENPFAVDAGSVAGVVVSLNGVPVPGAVVEIGVWKDHPELFYAAPSFKTDLMTDPHFQLVAHTTTDAVGRFVLGGLSRSSTFALRATPPDGAGLAPGYYFQLLQLQATPEVQTRLTVPAATP